MHLLRPLPPVWRQPVKPLLKRNRRKAVKSDGDCDHWLGIRETVIHKPIQFAYCPKCGEKL